MLQEFGVGSDDGFDGRSLSKVPVSIGIYVMMMTTLVTTINTLFKCITISGAFHVVFSWLTVFACTCNVIVVLMCCVPKSACWRVRTCLPHGSDGTGSLYGPRAVRACYGSKHLSQRVVIRTAHMAHCHSRWDGEIELRLDI